MNTAQDELKIILAAINNRDEKFFDRVSLKTLADDALEKIRAGLTTLTEVRRVLGLVGDDYFEHSARRIENNFGGDK